MKLGPPEINVYEPGALLLVGRDYGRHEARAKRPFVGRAGAVLDECLGLAGLSRGSVNVTNVVNAKPAGNRFEAWRNADIEDGLAELRFCIEKTEPGIIVALGNEAAEALIGEPTPASLRRASGIEETRGYVWTGNDEIAMGIEVLTTIHPAAVDRQWVPWAPLLVRDLAKAQRYLEGIAELRARDVDVL